MRLLFLFTGAVFLSAAASFASAQVAPPGVPTTVQLPTFEVFTVQTTVSVPDSGGMALGGINRAADGSVMRGIGPLRSRSLGSTRSASGMSVHATIHDREEMDRAVLAAAGGKREPIDLATSRATELSRGIGSSKAPPGSVAAIREEAATAADRQAAQLSAYFQKGVQAERDGRVGLAKIYYQMVARGNHGQLKQQAVARLAVIGSSERIVATKR